MRESKQSPGILRRAAPNKKPPEIMVVNSEASERMKRSQGCFTEIDNTDEQELELEDGSMERASKKGRVYTDMESLIIQLSNVYFISLLHFNTLCCNRMDYDKIATTIPKRKCTLSWQDD